MNKLCGLFVLGQLEPAFPQERLVSTPSLCQVETVFCAGAALCAGAAPSHAQPVVAAHGLQPPTALLVDGPLFTKTKVLKGLAPILVWLQSFLNTVIRFVF